jgi:hypothetical protein
MLKVIKLFQKEVVIAAQLCQVFGMRLEMYVIKGGVMVFSGCNAALLNKEVMLEGISSSLLKALFDNVIPPATVIILERDFKNPNYYHQSKHTNYL